MKPLSIAGPAAFAGRVAAVVLLAAVPGLGVPADPPPAQASDHSPPAAPPAEPGQAALAERLRLRIQHGQRVEFIETPVLDPVIFTEISPYAVDPDPVRLPEEQRLE